MATRALRSRAANGILALASLVAFGLLAEGAARLVDLRPSLGRATSNPPWLGERWLLHRRDYREELAEAGVLARYYDLYQWDRYLFFRLRPDRQLVLIDPLAPDRDGPHSRWSVRTNARGFRSGEFADAPAPGVRRILALGDSSTFGWGVEASDSYPERLRAPLAARLGVDGAAVEVLNLGVPGYSSFQGRVLLERVGLALAPDLVTWSFLSNDGAPTGEGDRAAYERRLGAAGALLALLHQSRAYETLEAWIGAARQRPIAQPDPRDPAARNVASADEAERNVRDAVAAAQAAGVPIVLVAQCVRGAPAKLLERVARSARVPNVDATGLLDAAVPRIAAAPEYHRERARLERRFGLNELRANPRLLAFLPDGCHPNALGHGLVAEALAEVAAPLLAREGG